MNVNIPQTGIPINTNIPMAPAAPAAPPAQTGSVPTESVSLGQAQPQAPAWQPGWNPKVALNNGVQAQVYKDQAGKTTQGVVASLLGPLMPAAINVAWNSGPDNPGVTASLVAKPDVKLETVKANDGQIYIKAEPTGGNPQAPWVVFNPETLSVGLADGAVRQPDGTLYRGRQEYHNADGTMTLIADEVSKPNGETGLMERHYTRVDGQGAVDVHEVPKKPNELLNTYMALSTYGLYKGDSEVKIETKTQPAAITQDAQRNLVITHQPEVAGGLPSWNSVKQTAGQWGAQASDTATSWNQQASKKLEGVGGGWLKKAFDFGMKGGVLGNRGHNVGQGFFNKETAPPAPTQPPQQPQGRVTVVQPFSVAMQATPGLLFPGLDALLKG